MSVVINGIEVTSMTLNGIEVKSWVHDGVDVWSNSPDNLQVYVGRLNGEASYVTIDSINDLYVSYDVRPGAFASRAAYYVGAGSAEDRNTVNIKLGSCKRAIVKFRWNITNGGYPEAVSGGNLGYCKINDVFAYNYDNVIVSDSVTNIANEITIEITEDTTFDLYAWSSVVADSFVWNRMWMTEVTLYKN